MEKKRPSRRKQINEEFLPRSLPPAGEPRESAGAGGIAPIVLPHGYEICVNDEEERRYAAATAEPYIAQSAEIPPDFWAGIYNLVLMYIDVFRMERLLSDESYVRRNPAKDINALRTNMLRTRQLIASYKLDPLKGKRREEGASAAEALENARQSAVAYAREHVGEFTWRCPRCGGMNMMEVPHFAYDSAAGTHVIWNAEIADAVRKYYTRHGDCDGALSVRDAARILRISPIGFLAICFERGFDLGVPFDLDKPETLKALVEG